MPGTVTVTFMPVVHKGSNSTALAFPDVCNTPSPAGPVPIPYPNIGMSSDISGGTEKVKVEGEMAMVKGATYTKSTGDEAGSNNGLVSGSIKGEVEFMLYSFNVKFEGNNACRMTDMTLQNKKNGLGCSL